MALFCCICESMGKIVPNFSKDKNTGLGYCGSHQNKRTDKKFQSIQQRAIEKHKLNPTKTPKKQPRFQRTIQTPTEKEIMEINGVSDLNSRIDFISPSPESFNGEQINRPIMDEVGVWVAPKDNIGMDAFWRYAEQVIAKKPYCWECGEYISKADYRNSTGHIFPKSIFFSVSDNIWNFVVVGNRCGCHHKTHTLATFSQMSIFPVAVQRYLKFGHLITENHKYLDLFLDYANQII